MPLLPPFRTWASVLSKACILLGSWEHFPLEEMPEIISPPLLQMRKSRPASRSHLPKQQRRVHEPELYTLTVRVQSPGQVTYFSSLFASLTQGIRVPVPPMVVGGPTEVMHSYGTGSTHTHQISSQGHVARWWLRRDRQGPPSAGLTPHTCV